MKNRINMVCAAGLSLLMGCTLVKVGPDYQASDFGAGEALTRAVNPTGATNDVSQQLVTWWNTFNDPMLTSLIQRALATNREVLIAESTIRQSRALLGIAASTLLPGLDGRARYQRFGQSQNGSIFPGMGNVDRNQYQSGFDAVWEIDIFGGNTRRVEAAMAGVEVAFAKGEAVKVSLAAEVANTYVRYRTAQRRLEIAQTHQLIQTETLRLVESRLKSGLANELPLHQASYQLEMTRAAIPAIRAELEVYANALAILVGLFPGELQDELKAVRSIPSIPRQQLEGISAECVRQRPDVQAAERQVAVAVAAIGMAKSDLYPKFALNGSVGLESLKWSNFFAGDSMAYSFGPQASWAIFRGGSILKNIEVKTELQKQTLAVYEQTVLNAAKEVRDTMVAYQMEQERLTSLTQAVEAARKAVKISDDLYKNGVVDFDTVLEAQRSLASLEENQAMSQGTISSQLIRLYKALGGGWQRLGVEITK